MWYQIATTILFIVLALTLWGQAKRIDVLTDRNTALLELIIKHLALAIQEDEEE